MSATKNEYNQGSPSIYRPEANAWISKRSSDLDYKGVFALIKIGFLQSSFYEVMWSSLCEVLSYRVREPVKQIVKKKKKKNRLLHSSTNLLS